MKRILALENAAFPVADRVEMALRRFRLCCTSDHGYVNPHGQLLQIVLDYCSATTGQDCMLDAYVGSGVVDEACLAVLY